MKTHASSRALRFRWINAQCFEFQFPNGTTLLTDPFFDCKPEDPKSPINNFLLPEPFTAEDIEGADYVFLNHLHSDHSYNLSDVFEKFHSTVITHSATAMETAKAFDIPLTSIYPVDFGDVYYFDGFSIETFHGTHHHQKSRLSGWNSTGLVKDFGEQYATVNAMGSIFNMNFLLTTDEGMRIMFVGGNNDGMLERIRRIRPNIVIRNKMHSSKELNNVAEDWADFMIQSGCQLMIPMHYETWLNTKPGFVDQVFADMNGIMEARNLPGRVAPLERTKWYTLNLCISED